MMSEELSSNGVLKARSALGDLTNQVGKRGFSLISSSGVKFGVDSKNEEGSQVVKRECLRVVDSLNKENLNKENADCVLRRHSCIEINSLKGNVIASISKIPCETKEQKDGRGNDTSDTAAKSVDAVRDSCVSSHSAPTSLSDRESADIRRETEKNEQNDPQDLGKAETSVGVDDDNDLSQDNLDSCKDDYLDCSRFLESQESRSCGLERCIGQKADGHSTKGLDLIKACPCSFCMKAAYIWSDLHYQDIKGRIAVLKKSQKEASILVERHGRDNGIGRYSQGNFNKFSKLESDLTGQWRSLFLHMENILGRECSQLETSLFELKELRDNCKTGLEPSDGTVSSEKQ